MAEGGDSTRRTPFRGHVRIDVAEWTVGRDAVSKQKRTDIIFTIMEHCHTDHLRTILNSGWDVNEVISLTSMNRFTTHWTALQAAAARGWTEGVKMLFDKGAKNMVPGVHIPPLQRALDNDDCPVQLIELLLDHGADPHHQGTSFECVPLIQAIYRPSNENHTKIVQCLLEKGADPNITGKLEPEWDKKSPREPVKEYHTCPLSAVLDNLFNRILYADPMKNPVMGNAELFKTLIDFGANVNWNMEGTAPLLHTMMSPLFESSMGPKKILQDYQNIFFQNGGNINMKYGDQGAALGYVVTEGGHSYSVRWLIRHGADIPPTMFALICRHLILQFDHQHLFEETPLLLLQAGMRVSHRTYKHLCDIEKEMSTWIGPDNSWAYTGTVMPIWAQLMREEKETSQKPKKHTFPEYLSTQMVDLEEFSDESLLVYPETFPENSQAEDRHAFALDQIHKVLDFLSQPQSLQWYCWRCVRENLVSLQPSVVKNLPLPSKMKRFILCHEI